MKRFSLLFFLFLLGTFHAFAQTHFITAGQTNGMIFTDYVPDFYIQEYQTNPPDPHFYAGKTELDVNHDSVIDFTINTTRQQQLSGGASSCSIQPAFYCFIMCKVDTLFGNGVAGGSYLVAKRHGQGDTINYEPSMIWRSASTFIESYSFFSGNSTRLYDRDFPVDSPCWFALMVITPPDTAFGYIHFSTRNKIYEFACEGPTSSHIINSVNGLSPSNISISPNPFSSQINISTEKPFQYTITDYSGRLLLQGTTDKTIGTETIPSGSYLLTIKNEEVFSVKKMVKY